MRLLYDVALGVLESIKETLPGDEQEAACWVGGFCWSFAIHWILLITVTLAAGWHR